MSLREDIDEWRQPDGLIVPKQERIGVENIDTTGDGIKHFCLYHALLVRRGESKPEDFEEFERVIRSCFIRPGLPHRSPTKTEEQIGKDAIIAIAYAAKMMNSRLAWEVLNYGNSARFLSIKWFYPNLFPELFENGGKVPLSMIFKRNFWQAWIGKNPEVICHLQYAGLPSNHEPHFFRKVWLWVFLIVSSVSKGTVYSLAYMMCEIASGKDDYGEIFIEIWKSRIKNAGGIINRLKEEYEEDHPLVRYWV